MSEQIREQAVGAAVAASIALTVLCNLPDRRIDIHRLSSRSAFAIPNWRFFGPNPGISNAYLLVRHRRQDGTCTDWFDPLPVRRRPLVPIVWNPVNRQPKVLIDVVQELLAASRRFNADFAKMAEIAAYQRIVDVVRDHVPYPDDADAAQFMLLQTIPKTATENGDLEPVITSEFIERPTVTA